MEYEIKRDGGTLYCRREGSGPLLLLIHGVACDSDFFCETAHLLAQHFTVLTYDRRGYSRSHMAESGEGDSVQQEHSISRSSNEGKGKENTRRLHGKVEIRKDLLTAKNSEDVLESVPQKDKLSVLDPGIAGSGIDFSVRTQAEDAAAVIRECGSQKAFVAGCSAGGAVASALAHSHPDRVSGLFLHEPLLMGDGEIRVEQEAFWEKLDKSRQRHRIISCMMHFINAMGGVDRTKGSQPMERQQQNFKNLELFLYHEMDSFRQLQAADLSITAPVWVAAGCDDAEGMFRRSACRAAEIQNWPLLPVPGYHNFASDEPELFAKCIEQCYRESGNR